MPVDIRSFRYPLGAVEKTDRGWLCPPGQAHYCTNFTSTERWDAEYVSKKLDPRRRLVGCMKVQFYSGCFRSYARRLAPVGSRVPRCPPPFRGVYPGIERNRTDPMIILEAFLGGPFFPVLVLYCLIHGFFRLVTLLSGLEAKIRQLVKLYRLRIRVKNHCSMQDSRMKIPEFSRFI